MPQVSLYLNFNENQILKVNRSISVVVLMLCLLSVLCPSDCTDSNVYCPDWSSNGECANNPDYMLINCKKSCNACGGSSSSLFVYLYTSLSPFLTHWLHAETIETYERKKQGE